MIPDSPQPENQPQPSEDHEAAADGPTSGDLKSAMKAFKKRLKLARLDADSGLGHGPTSGGRDSGIVAITPPSQYPQAVWDELVRRGRLRYAGHGLYEKVDVSAG